MQGKGKQVRLKTDDVSTDAEVEGDITKQAGQGEAAQRMNRSRKTEMNKKTRTE